MINRHVMVELNVEQQVVEIKNMLFLEYFETI